MTRMDNQAGNPHVAQRSLRNGSLASQGITRRDLFKATGVLVVGFTLLGPGAIRSAAAQSRLRVPPEQLDSWLAISEDGSVTLFTGKVDLGTGVETAMMQIAAEELDVPLDRIRVVLGDTSSTVDQGSTTGSNSIASGGRQVRQAAAEARATLHSLAEEQLAAAPEDIVAEPGAFSVRRDASRRVTYAQLLGGKRFDLEMAGTATPKSTDSYAIVGQPIPRIDIPSKVTGTATYVQDIRLPGLLHARVIKPAGIGSMLLNVDRDSIRDIPGIVQVVVKGNFVGVVAEREEQAIWAAERLDVTWSDWAGLPSTGEIYEALRATPSEAQVNVETGDVAAALSDAKTTVERTYLFPFQTHGSIGPSCAVADVRNGQAIIWSGTQGAHRLRQTIAETLGLAQEQVRVIWVQGSGSYGSNGADDATVDAAILSDAVGRPVRLQWMRADEHRWSTAGPGMVFDIQGGLDSEGQVVAWNYEVYTPSHYYDDVLADYLTARQPARPDGKPNRSSPWGGDARTFYKFPGAVREVVHQLQATPVRSKTLRAPGQVGVTFALESFMDELAAAAGVDPIAFRLQHLVDERASAVVRAAAEAAGWEPRRWPRATFDASGKAIGRGFAAVQRPGGSGPNTYVGMVAEVEVDRDTGEVLVTRVVVAHDCGLIINPDGVRNQVEGNVIQTLSRTLKEELAFDASNVTSVDWRSYPILTFPEVPDIEIVLINRLDQPASGVGEPASCPVPAAVANAIFDATGVRLNEVPFTADRVKAALS